MLQILIYGAFGLPVVVWGAYLKILRDAIKYNRVVQHEIIPASPVGVAGLDEAKLQKATQQLESLGFVQLQDYFINTFNPGSRELAESMAPIASPVENLASVPSLPPPRLQPEAFTRVLVHPEHGCLGTIKFLSLADTQGKKKLKYWLTTTITSISGTGPDDWSYSTSNQNFDPWLDISFKLLRHDQRLITQVRDAGPEEFLEIHLARRAEVAKAAGTNWKMDLSLEDQHALDDRSYEYFRSVYRRLTPMSAAGQLIRLRYEEKSLEWQGELEGKLN